MGDVLKDFSISDRRSNPVVYAASVEEKHHARFLKCCSLVAFQNHRTDVIAFFFMVGMIRERYV